MRLNAILLTMALALWAATPLAGQGELSGLERRIVEAVEASADEGIGLLERVVDINSGTMNLEGVRAVGGIFSRELEALGAQTEWIDGAPFQRSGHVVARHLGSSSGPHLLLIGHLDTVFEPESPFQHFEREGDIATGPGVVDMKGGNVVIVQALRALSAVGLLEKMTITVVMTGDEERPGRPLALARAALTEAAEEADIALAFENGDSDPRTAVVARRGFTAWRLDVTGTPSHSSQIFQPAVGVGAIYEAARILNEFHGRLSREEHLTFNPGVILGGTDVTYDAEQERGTAFGKSNVVAEHAVVAGDLRALTSEQAESARARMADIVAGSLPGASAAITFDEGYPPLAPSDGNLQLLALFDGVSRDLGFGPVSAVDPRNAGAADVAFVAGLVDMAIDGLGPGGGAGHTVEEWIDLPLLVQQTKRAAVLMHRLTR